ncbi:TPR end-of-group domain-containing protein [Emticicia fontis]
MSALNLDPTRRETLYYFACLFALQNQSEKSLLYLESAINKSFRDFKYIETDTDLNNIRHLPQFSALIEKYKK